MKIHGDFIGGNVMVKNQTENNIYIANDLRDTQGEWFYWAFCVEGAAGKKLVFHFDKNRLGYWGPAVSHNLKDWHWLDNCNGDSFTYNFAEDENKVYFAHHMLYHPERFCSFAKSQGFEIAELCKSRKGRCVPCVKFGNGNKHVIVTARHHACESTGNYVLEGMLTELVKSMPSDISVLCVPFVDYDGVVDGDQGKSRYPHDHNRDYTEKSIYPEVAAIKAYAEKYGCNYGFDFHSPWHKGDENDTVFIVRNSIEKTDRFERFADILESEITENSMAYKKTNDHPPFTGWNQPSTSFACVMTNRPECDIAFALESAYFGTEENKVSPDRLVELGKCFAVSVKRYIKESLRNG